MQSSLSVAKQSNRSQPDSIETHRSISRVSLRICSLALFSNCDRWTMSSNWTLCSSSCFSSRCNNKHGAGRVESNTAGRWPAVFTICHSNTGSSAGCQRALSNVHIIILLFTNSSAVPYVTTAARSAVKAISVQCNALSVLHSPQSTPQVYGAFDVP